MGNTNTYLRDVLTSQTLKQDSDELTALRDHREDVEELLQNKFSESSPRIRYGGSVAKGTLIKESYDLDLTCYFQRDENAAGETLEEIYNNVEAALNDDYFVERKPSALRLKSKDDNSATDFHIDVVPGRFVDDTETDV